jgi:hypothetical protein
MKKSRGISTKRPSPPSSGVPARIAAIQARLVRLDHISSGTLHTRTKVCGKPNCRCAQDPADRHGPYHEWSWREGSRGVHLVITPDQAKALSRALRNYRKVKSLLARWEEESARAILGEEDVNA